jgi:cysteine desulfurase/selenocysteine lyase
LTYDVESIRAQFPILHQDVHGEPLAYLDNAATSQKPQAVLDAESRYYTRDNSNIHRGVHALSERATKDYEAARAKIANFLGATDAHEIIFLRGTTEAINLVANTHVRELVGPGDEILISHMEHHSNIVPWQMLCQQSGAQLVVVPIDDDGALDMEAFHRALSSGKIKFVAMAHVSNALGTINPVKEIVTAAHKVGATVLLDGAQAAPHSKVDVQDIGCDFYAISGHKMYAPTGVGALWGKKELLDAMPPWQGGGDMILSVKFTGTTYNEVPFKFEAGTPNIAGGIGLGAAVDWLESVGVDAIAAHEHELLVYATAALQAIPGIRIIGTAPQKAGVLSFTIDGVHPHDVGSLLDRHGIAIRTGHHCAQPVMDRFGVPATNRASFAAYNTHEEVDRLVAGVHEIITMFQGAVQ